jgi:hypothetical protein
MVNAVLGLLSSVPSTVAPPAKTPSSTGKFWPSLEPVSASSVSFALTPVPLTSIPNEPLSWIELPRIALPASAVSAITTPVVTLYAMWFGASPPTRAFVMWLRRRMPWRPFGTGVTPSAPTPIVLPWMS